MAITFDPSTKRIILDSSYVEVQDLYSRWKEWVMTDDNAKYQQAFRVVGGDPLGGNLYVSLYCFLLNGWKIRPMEANHTLTIHGNLADDTGTDPVVRTLGDYQVLVQYVVPERAQGIAVSGSGSSLTAAQIAAAVRSELSAELAKIDAITVTDGKVEAAVESNLFVKTSSGWQSV